MYDGFMRSQQLLMTSRRIVEEALKTRIWQATGRGQSIAILLDFADNLKVERPPGTENLRITFTSEDSSITAAAVNSLIEAYERDYKDADAELQQKRIGLLTELENEHRRAVDDLNQQLASRKGEGSADLEQLHAAAVQRLVQYESRLADVELGLALTQGRGPSDVARVMTPRQIGMIDGRMADLLAEQARLERELQSMLLRLGSEHGHVIAMRAAVAQAKTQVEQYTRDYRELEAQRAQNPEQSSKGAAMSVFAQPLKALQADRDVLTKLVEQAKQTVASLSTKRQEVDALKLQIAKDQKALADVTDRKAVLSLELALGDRLEITSRGQVPLAPIRDTRKRFAAAGGLVGMLLPAGLVALFGVFNRRYRFSDEACDDLSLGRKLPLLGVLPILPRHLTDGELATDAAQCVHQIRAMLQNKIQGNGSRVYLVSSSSPGEGKTSLCVSLGLSFGAAGSRTLLIDADLVGRGLTRGLRADGVPGLREALETGRLAIREQPDRISVLTAGDADASDACKVSPAAMARLIADTRRHFDIVLIDSGPILGSVEAAIVAREVDGVIFTIARGQEPGIVDRALRHLESIGAKVVGAVFNRARGSDLYRSFQGSSQRSEGTPESRQRALGLDGPLHFGPVVGSVASFLPGSSDYARR
jgi:Mrp family chromosome partitioning ATPase/uncharacterized protein involved in exopolysaccharide biosynthesis